jgi:hypothetical protein
MPELTARKTLHRLKCEEVFVGDGEGELKLQKFGESGSAPPINALVKI